MKTQRGAEGLALTINVLSRGWTAQADDRPVRGRWGATVMHDRDAESIHVWNIADWATFVRERNQSYR